MALEYFMNSYDRTPKHNKLGAKIRGSTKTGGALRNKFVQDIIKETKKEPSKRESVFDQGVEYKLDPMSNRIVGVWYNNNNNHAIVSHRSTDPSSVTDVLADIGLGIVGKTKGKRFSEAEIIQRKAETKYGKNNISIIGYSLGGTVASVLSSKGKYKDIITYNKGVGMDILRKDVKENPDEHVVRTKYDPVSFMRNFMGKSKKSKKETVIPSGMMVSPLSIIGEHGNEKLERLDDNYLLGNGLTIKQLKKMKVAQLKLIIKSLRPKGRTAEFKITGKKRHELYLMAVKLI